MKNIELKGGIGGRYLVEKGVPGGKKEIAADWFENLITDAGLNRLGTGGAYSQCQVGTGSTTPDVTDTALANWLATETVETSSQTGVESSSPYYAWVRTTWRFNPGEATGNLSELGVGWAGGLFSRALIKDALGDPTTITILPEEYLDITYEVRIYPPLTDSEITIDIGGVSHDVTVRASGVGTSAWNPTFFLPFGVVGGYNVTCYDGAIGALTGLPSGATSGVTSTTGRSYVDESLSHTFDAALGLDKGNVGGIKSFRFGQQSLGTFQAEFDPVINKDNTKTLNLPFTLSWARKV